MNRQLVPQSIGNTGSFDRNATCVGWLRSPHAIVMDFLVASETWVVVTSARGAISWVTFVSARVIVLTASLRILWTVEEEEEDGAGRKPFEQGKPQLRLQEWLGQNNITRSTLKLCGDRCTRQ